MQTTSPSDWELYMKGHIEVPKCPARARRAPAIAAMAAATAAYSRPPPPDGMIGPNEAVPAAPTRRQDARPHNRYPPPNRTLRARQGRRPSRDGPPGLIGPVGYDVVK